MKKHTIIKITATIIITILIISIFSTNIFALNNHSFLQSNDNSNPNSNTSEFITENISHIESSSLQGNSTIYISNPIYFTDKNDTIQQQIQIETDLEYDSLSIVYLNTDGITMQSKSYTETQENKIVPISFSPQNTKLSLSEKNIYDFEEDEIIVKLSFWNKGILQDNQDIEIWIFTTPYGTFISDVDQLFNKTNYNNYLLENEIIDEATYEDLDVQFHYFKSDHTQEVEYQLSAFDSTTPNKLKAQIHSVLNQQYVTTDSGSLTRAAVTTVKSNSAEIEYDIITSDSGNTFTISGRVYWYGKSSGNTNGIRYPAQYVRIDIVDQDVSFDDTLATVTTDANGYFSKMVENQTFIGENGCDIYMKVYCGNDNTFTYALSLNTTLVEILLSSNPYYFSTTLFSNLKTPKPSCYDSTASDSIIGKAFSISNALYYSREYEKQINGGSCLNNTPVKLYYPLPFIETSFTLPVLDRGSVLLGADDYNHWDTIIHEYGHAIEDKLEIFIGYTDLISKKAFKHYAKANLTDYYFGNKEKALHISWNEGWASYYSWCVQRYYTLYNSSYPQTSSTIIWQYDIVAGTWYGEDNELAVATVLTNLVTNNLFTEKQLWDMVKNNRPTSFEDLSNLIMEALMGDTASNMFTPALNQYFDILEKQNFSAKVSTSSVSTYCPTFTWTTPTLSSANTNGFVYDYRYNISFVNTDLSYYYITPLISGTSYTPSVNEWNQIIANSPNGFYWMVKTVEYTTPSSAGYYSRFRYCTYQNDILETQIGVNYNISLNTIATRTATDGTSIPAKTNVEWFKFTAPYTATYSFYTEGTVDTYGAFYNTIKSDYDTSGKIASDDDGGTNTNFMLNRYMEQGETILISIRGYSSNSIGTTSFKIKIAPTEITELQTPYNNILSTGSQHWYSFIPSSTGTYTICSLSNMDIVCEMYNSTGTFMQRNDDAGVSLNFSITENLNAGELYYFMVEGITDDTMGDYQFYIILTPIVTYNSSYIDFLNEDVRWYRFQAPFTGTYVFYTDYTDSYDFVDTNGSLYSDINPSGDTRSLLAFHDDISFEDENVHFRIVYELQANQVVYLQIGGCGPFDRGEFVLYIEHEPAAQVPEATNTIQVPSILEKQLDLTECNTKKHDFYSIAPKIENIDSPIVTLKKIF